MSIPYSTLRQAVRRYRPSDFVRGLSAFSAKRDPLGGGGYGDLAKPPYPWVVSALARESLVYGNESRRPADPGEMEILSLHRLYDRVDLGQRDSSLASVITPVAHEQFAYQEPTYGELTRSIALYGDTRFGPVLPWEDSLGVGLVDAVRAAMVLRTWAVKNEGVYEPAVWTNPAMDEVYEKASPKSDLVEVMRALSAEPAQFRVAAGSAVKTDSPYYAHNPLVETPIVRFVDGSTFAPQSMLITQCLHPANLYYRGIGAWGQAYANELGHRVERYVGATLELLSSEVREEIVYGGDNRSVDWFVKVGRTLVLVESKSARLGLDARAGGSSLPHVVQRSIGKARDQLERTRRLIEQGHPVFDVLGEYDEILGIAVTSDPFYFANSGIDEYGARAPGTTVMSLREMEQWVMLDQTSAIDLLRRACFDAEASTWSFGSVMRDDGGRGLRNPILESAWQKLKFEHAGLATPDDQPG